jgi:outer membrane biosynthesis protein TonB
MKSRTISFFMSGILAFPFTGLGQSNNFPSTQINAVPGSAERPIRLASGVMARNLLHQEEPKYPENLDASGTVVMVTVIDNQGKVVNVKPFSGPEVLRSAAVDAVRKWTYKPYILNGSPAYVQTTITVMFSR